MLMTFCRGDLWSPAGGQRPPLQTRIEMLRSFVGRDVPKISIPPVKGGGTAVRRDGGIDNPSGCYASSSPYTGEPNRTDYTLVGADSISALWRAIRESPLQRTNNVELIASCKKRRLKRDVFQNIYLPAQHFLYLRPLPQRHFSFLSGVFIFAASSAV